MCRSELQHPGKIRKPSLVSDLHAAFSLIEVVLAVGVISFALVGIIGLFPVAMQSATDSQRETQVAFIARSLFHELQRVDGDKAYVTVTNTDESGERQSLDASGVERRLINFDSPPPPPNPTDSNYPLEFYFDADGSMVTAKARALYAARVIVDKTNQPDGLARVDINISVPADAPAANQTTYNFVTLINFTPSTSTPPAP